jgi:hypothetical protein
MSDAGQTHPTTPAETAAGFDSMRALARLALIEQEVTRGAPLVDAEDVQPVVGPEV